MRTFMFPFVECPFCCCWRKMPFWFNGMIEVVETPFWFSPLLLLLLLSLLVPSKPFNPICVPLIKRLFPFRHIFSFTLLTLLLLFSFIILLLFSSFKSCLIPFSDLNSSWCRLLFCAFELFCASFEDKLGFRVIITFLDVEVVFVISSLFPLASCWITFVDFRLTVEAAGVRLKC